MLEQKRERWSLSGAQLGIWYAQQLDPDNPIFNTAECIEIRGPVDPVLFEKALRQVVGRPMPCLPASAKMRTVLGSRSIRLLTGLYM